MIFFVMLLLLRVDNASEDSIEQAQCHLVELAEAIAVEAKNKDEVLDLIAVGFWESRFSYRGKSRGVDGECGIYQQIPKYAHPQHIPKPSCEDLDNPWKSTYRAAEAFRFMKSEFPPRDRFCHYNSGMECYPKSRVYQRKINYYRKKIDLLIGWMEIVYGEIMSGYFRQTIRVCTLEEEYIQ